MPDKQNPENSDNSLKVNTQVETLISPINDAGPTSDEINTAKAQKMAQVAINNLFSKKMKALKAQAKKVLDDLNTQIKLEEEKLSLLKNVDAQKNQQKNALNSQHQSNKKLIDNLTAANNALLKEFAKQSAPSVAGAPPPPPPQAGPPPPPEMGPPLPPKSKASTKLRTRKNPKKENANKKAEPAQFDPNSAINFKLRSTKDPHPLAKKPDASESASLEQKQSRAEMIEKLINDKLAALDKEKENVIAQIKKANDKLEKLHQQYSTTTAKYVNSEKHDTQKILEKIVLVEKSVIKKQQKQAEQLQKKKELLAAIEKAKEPIPLPEPVKPAPIADPKDIPNAPPPPPSVGMPPPPPISGIDKKKATKKNPSKTKADKKGKKTQETDKVNIAAGISSSKQYQELRKKALEKEREDEKARIKAEKARKAAEKAEYERRVKEINQSIAEVRDTIPDDPEQIERLRELEARHAEIQVKDASIKILADKELDELRNALDEAEAAQKADYEARLKARDSVGSQSERADINPPEIQDKSPEQPEPEELQASTDLTDNLSSLLEAALAEEKTEVNTDPVKSITPAHAAAEPSAKAADDTNNQVKRKIVEAFIETYKVRPWTNTSRIKQLSNLSSAYKKKDSKALDAAIEEIRRQMFVGEGTKTRQAHETRKLGESKMEAMIKNYLDVGKTDQVVATNAQTEDRHSGRGKGR